MSEQTIIQGDCLEVMKTFADKSFDLVLTDPPYGIGNFQNTGDANKYKLRKEREYGDELIWNKEIPSQEYFKEIERVSREQIIWGANYFNCFSYGGALVWDKDNESSQRYSNCEIASISTQKRVNIFRFRWNGMLQEDMKHKEFRYHPTQKPLDVMKWCISLLPGAINILDPFMGSGTTLVAAKHLNRNATGIEISEKYCEIAQKRLSQDMLF